MHLRLTCPTTSDGLYSTPGNKVFPFVRNRLPDSQKQFRFDNCFPVRNVFHSSFPAGLAKNNSVQKHHPFENRFRSQIVIWAEFESFWLILGHFGSFLGSEMFFLRSKGFLVRNVLRSFRAGLAKQFERENNYGRNVLRKKNNLARKTKTAFPDAL